MTNQPSKTRQHSGSAFDFVRSYKFNTAQDECKIDCNVEILKPTTYGGYFKTDVFLGRDPENMSIHFLSVLPNIPGAPAEFLDEALKESRGEAPNYPDDDDIRIGNARRIIQHMKDLIQIYC